MRTALDTRSEIAQVSLADVFFAELVSLNFEPDCQKAKTAHHSMLGLTDDDNTVEHESQGNPV